MIIYEVMWFSDHDNVIEDCFTLEFKSKKEAIDYYLKHKDDKDKYGFKVTKRNERLEILECYIEDVIK